MVRIFAEPPVTAGTTKLLLFFLKNHTARVKEMLVFSGIVHDSNIYTLPSNNLFVNEI